MLNDDNERRKNHNLLNYKWEKLNNVPLVFWYKNQFYFLIFAGEYTSHSFEFNGSSSLFNSNNKSYYFTSNANIPSDHRFVGGINLRNTILLLYHYLLFDMDMNKTSELTNWSKLILPPTITIEKDQIINTIINTDIIRYTPIILQDILDNTNYKIKGFWNNLLVAEKDEDFLYFHYNSETSIWYMTDSPFWNGRIYINEAKLAYKRTSTILRNGDHGTNYSLQDRKKNYKNIYVS
jgi:hypothetical protein